MPTHIDLVPPAEQQKHRSGLDRIRHALGFSLAGLRAGWGETAFRQETLVACIGVPLAFWVGRSWVEVSLLAGSIVLVMVVELLNTAIEAAIDRIGPERHPLSKRAKDMGSAAVLLAVLLAAGMWGTALFQRLSG
jgi:diacylglycerol kinase (ATP)